MTLLDALRDIRDDGPPLTADGICFNVEELVPETENGQTQDELQLLMSRWPHADANSTYPVEGHAERYMCAQRMGTVWQNPRRIALLDWMIKELEKEEL